MDLAITEVANDVVRISEKVNERVYLVESAVNDDGSWYRKCGMRGRIMLGTKLYKNNKSDMANYTKTAVWCNANDAHVEDKGSYYEVCENVAPELTIDEKLVKLDSQYNSEVTRLGNEYMSATLRSDSDTQQELTQEMLELDEWYDTEYNNIIGGDE